MNRFFRLTCLAIVGLQLAAALSGCGNKGNTLHIATKPMTEQYILGEMLKLLIEQNTNYAVTLTAGVGGGTANIHPALLKGEFDLYPEYTGTAWSYVLKNDPLEDESALETALFDVYRDQYDLEWVGLYGFSNTYGLAVSSALADQYDLNTYSDLAAIAPQLTFGGEYDFFEREDGYTALCQTYGLTFQKTVDLDIGLKYDALAKGSVDVINVFTTDGRLSTAPVTLLEDDRAFYPTYYCGTVVRTDALAQVDGLEEALLLMEGLISSSEMAAMNYAVEQDGKSEQEVATDFLTTKGLLK